MRPDGFAFLAILTVCVLTCVAIFFGFWVPTYGFASKDFADPKDG